jgi:hypothetical protein
MGKFVGGGDRAKMAQGLHVVESGSLIVDTSPGLKQLYRYLSLALLLGSIGCGLMLALSGCLPG